MDDPPKNAGFKRNLAGFGTTIAAAMLGFTLGGVWLDKKFGGGIIFTLSGVGCAVFYIGYELWKLNAATRVGSDSEEESVGTRNDEH